ncbi:ABC transporter permease [Sphingomicrobium clamense]|uniref:MlaE family lipid ABC transporter permease subunit n=1 Tax=Sphingomicrobium clamense TaxID=2851013 RepID=A0ABS6V562_9SPHN|nr:MlaE family lipid ABC transporter permease subunit [Sphingomicrobium sp. B8]MBW0144218.1 MlaE family lipid ABC transporter permease subunit [Sphingomicrobium sp. B8]
MGDEPNSQATSDASGHRIELSGPLTIARVGTTERSFEETPDPLIIDASGIERIDTVGAWLLYRTRKERGAEIVGANETVRELIAEVESQDQGVHVRPEKKPGPYQTLEELGHWTTETGKTFVGLIGFFGSVLIAIASILRHPKRFRFNAVVQRFDLVGVRALGIIGLMSFLIGIVVGQQGAVQLQQFGAEVFTINLIGRINVRELGTLMTAIMVAGRSGSAFAAQLGTMKITEEIDAMRTIGVSPVEALVLPRLLAAVVMMPLLAFWAMLMSLVGGGLFVWVGLDIPPLTYIQRLQEVTPLTDVWVGLIKAPIFGFFIALTGCYQGMQVKGNSEEVGLRTTTAVVQSIFIVIVLDAVFAVFFSQIGWN